MKALVGPRYGDDTVLRFEDVPVPKPRDGEVLVRVTASAVNRTDTGILSGRPFFARAVFGLRRPKRRITGTEFAGVIEQAGTDYSDLKVGDRVFGFHDEGCSAHAEYLVASGREALAAIPSCVSFEQAAACSEGPYYGLNFLRAIDLRPGSRVLINGISGGIGSAVLQLTKSRGAFVVGVCDGGDAPRLLALGADRVHDYRTVDFREAEAELFDFILDTVGNRAYRDCRALLSASGAYGSTELGAWGQNVLYAIGHSFAVKRRSIFPIPRNVSGCQSEMLPAIESGAYKPLIDRAYPFESAIEAFRYVAGGHKTGSVILVHGAPE